MCWPGSLDDELTGTIPNELWTIPGRKVLIKQEEMSIWTAEMSKWELLIAQTPRKCRFVSLQGCCSKATIDHKPLFAWWIVISNHNYPLSNVIKHIKTHYQPVSWLSTSELFTWLLWYDYCPSAYQRSSIINLQFNHPLIINEPANYSPAYSPWMNQLTIHH